MSSIFFYEPFAQFDRLFDEAFASRTGTTGQSNQRSIENGSAVMRPRMDLHEDLQSNTVTASFELPGFKKEDVQIDVHNGRLTVSAQSSTSSEKKDEGYAVRERRYGKFSRTLQLPQSIKSAPELAPKKIAIS